MKTSAILQLIVLLSFPTFSQTISDVPTQGLVAYYPFNGNANDSSGNGFNGTVIGATLAPDRFGNPAKAYSFNGIGNYIRFGDILDSVFCKPVAKFSVSGWARTRVPGQTFSGGGFIIGKEAGSGTGSHQWNIAHLDTRLFYWVNSDSNAANFVDRTNPIDTSTWFHFACIFDGSLPVSDRVKIYVNATSSMGTYSTAGSLGTSTQNTPQELTIGAGHQGGNPAIPNNQYNGMVDDIRIYNRSLSLNEVQALYHEGGWKGDVTPVRVAFYPLNGNAGDSSGHGFNGTVAGAAPTTNRFGVAGAAYSFNGVNSMIRFGNILDSVFSAPVSKFSVAGWARTRTYGSIAGGGGFIVGKNSGGGAHGPAQWNITHLDGVLYGAVFSDTAAQNYISLTSPITKSQWFHYALVFDGSLSELQRVRLWVNGSSVNTTIYQHVGTLGTKTTASQQNLTVGASHPGGNPTTPENPYDGDVDDISIYNYPLSETEIQTFYHEGGWPVQTVPDLVAYYPFNGNANDSSGHGFNGTVIGATLVPDRFLKPNSAFNFNGSTNYIRFGDILDSVFCKPVAQFTVSGWAKTTTPGSVASGGGFIIGKEAGGALPGAHQWTVGHLDTRLFCLVTDSAGLNYLDKTTPANVNHDWFHFVLIFDGSLPQQDRIKLYVNATSSMTTFAQLGSLGTSTQNTSQELTVGAGHQAYNPAIPNNAYNGAVDDIRIYNRAVTFDEVLSLYHEGGWAAGIDVPKIISVKDVPNDNGKQVLISWKVPRPAALNGISKFSVRLWDRANLNWVVVRGDIDAYPDTIHTTIATTLFDSTKSKGMYYSIFQIGAHGVTPEIVTISPSDSGYSLDNLPPLAPVAPTAKPGSGKSWVVSWRPPSGQLGDFKNYVIYRSTTPIFNLDVAHRLADVMDTVYSDNAVTTGTTYYYGITAMDYSGNESPAAIVSTVVGVRLDLLGVPDQFEISQNYPNPFNPSTVIRFGVPVRSRVKIEVFNVLGQSVGRLIDGEVEAGYHEREFNGVGASGVFVYRIEAISVTDPTKRFVAAYKMLLLK